MAQLSKWEGYTGCWICLNKPVYVLMSQYLCICLNNAEYDWTCHHVSEKMVFWKCQNSCLTQYIAVIGKMMYSEHCQTFKMEFFAKRIMPECRCGTRKFSRQGRRAFVGPEYFDKHFLKNMRKRGPVGKYFEVFLHLDTQNYILNEKFNPKMDTIRIFLSRIRILFLDFQKGLESPPLSQLVAR